MIDCTTKRVWYKKRKKIKRKKFFALFLSFIIIVITVIYYKAVVAKHIIEICCDYSYSYVTESINEAIMRSLRNKINYTDIITIEKNSVGDITLMQTNSIKVNYVNKEIAVTTKEILDKKLSEGVPIPLLSFTGIGLISGFGKTFNLKVVSVSSVLCDFDSNFISMGINQTLHSIYLNVTCELLIDIPSVKYIKKCDTPVLLSEAILVGKVPDVYLNGGLFK